MAAEGKSKVHTMELPEGKPYSVHDHIASIRKSLSVQELAPILGVSDDVLYRMVKDGKIPMMNLPGSGKFRFDPASICYWLRKHNPIMRDVARAS